jgi:hypothetical protein
MSIPGTILSQLVNHHDGIQGMGGDHQFHRVGDELPAGQRVFHAFMVHGDTVAHADDAKFHRRAAGHVNSGFDGFGKSVEVDMPGYDCVDCIGNAHQGAVDFIAGVTARFEQGAMGGAFHAGFDLGAFHWDAFHQKKTAISFLGLITDFVVPGLLC